GVGLHAVGGAEQFFDVAALELGDGKNVCAGEFHGDDLPCFAKVRGFYRLCLGSTRASSSPAGAARASAAGMVSRRQRPTARARSASGSPSPAGVSMQSQARARRRLAAGGWRSRLGARFCLLSFWPPRLMATGIWP